MAENTQQKHTPIVFQGKTSEYFGIWIVNLLLTIVTLGIYSAWAKVRRKKYFYNNTLIDNVGFDYHAKPISILKGRAIAFALFLVATVHPILQSLVFLLVFLFLPWLIVRGSLFNARNTSHRGLRFDFTGTVSKAVRVFIGLPLLTFFTLGLIVPYAAHEKNQFLMNNHRFGLSQFDMSRVVKGFYKVYAIVFIVPLIGILVAIAIPAYQAYVTKAKAVQHTQLSIPNVQAFSPTNTHMLLAANEVPATEEAPATDAMPNAADQELEPIADEAYEAAAPEMTAEEEKAMIEAMKKDEAQTKKDKMTDWFKSSTGLLTIFGGALLYGLFIFGFAGYMQARIGNLVWNNTKLDKLSFKSSLRARDMIWIYFTNIVAIVCTFGLATPWAQIRLARYRASKLSIVGDVDFDQFVGDKKDEVKATGEEIAEMFDVDLSFG
jgi:uncharacterized membrane protein YjgN (DUF898 family)